jgi:hypothetical protein
MFNRTTKDQLLDKTVMEEQLNLWQANQTGTLPSLHTETFSKLRATAGMLSAAPRSLALVSSSDILTTAALDNLVAAARGNLTQTAVEYSNGNPKLAAGISAQLTQQIDMYAQGTQLPMELNLGMAFT